MKRWLVATLVMAWCVIILAGCSLGQKPLNDRLCAEDESILFSFIAKDSAKVVSLLTSKGQQDYIVLRIGTSKQVELEFPKNKADSWSQFVYAYYLRGGGQANEGLDLNYIRFVDKGKDYEIYEEYSASDDTTRVGMRFADVASSKPEEIFGASNSALGSLKVLRDNNKIKKED